MIQHPENHPPPAGLRLAGDAAREIAALRRQVEECEHHNTELLTVLGAVRQWAQATERAALNRQAQGTQHPGEWQGQLKAAQAVWRIVKPVE